MAVRAVVRPREYFDSVFLMRVSERLTRVPGVRDAAAVMATDANKARLLDAGLWAPELAAARADDLVIALRADSETAADSAMHELSGALEVSAEQIVPARSLEEAIARRPDANVAVISVPGAYAAALIRRSLERGLHAFVFSGNVPIAEERALKEEAHRRGLLVMGPDCGTAIVGGIGLGFANVVRRGSIGVVGASGTGIQEITSLVHAAGAGISHALGTGSHDTTDEVGGISTVDALDVLAADEATRVIVLVSKPAGPAARACVDAAVARAGKPVVSYVLGDAPRTNDRGVRTFEEAAATALTIAHLGGALALDVAGSSERLARERASLARSQREVRGLFAGGSFALQAGTLLAEMNVPPDARTIVDLGSEALTDGRPHPMIDPRLRRERIAEASRDERVAVVLFDVVLGCGAARDPAGDLVGAIVAARAEARQAGRHLVFVASLTGTDGDPQGIAGQRATLEGAGVIVIATTARAARSAGAIVKGRV